MHIASHISRAMCLIKHDSTKLVFTFLILSCHLCLGPSQNYALKTIMSNICFKKSPAAPFVNSFVVETFANLQVAAVISNLFFHLPSEWNSWAPAGRSFVKFYDGLRRVKHVKKIQVWLSLQK